MYEINHKRDYKSLEKIISKIPPIEAILKRCNDENEVKKFLGHDEYDLIHWILTINRYSWSKIPKSQLINKAETKYQ